MKENFDNALKLVLVHEGGWSDHPRDPGGATMKGITLAVFQRHYGTNKTKDDLRNISDEQLKAIYRTDYWNKCLCDEIALGLDYAVFDAAVNSGPGRSAKWLQAAVGAPQDGAIGPVTLTNAAGKNTIDVINSACDRRLSFLRSLGTWSDFDKGWGRRVENVRASAIGMAGGQAVTPSVDYETVRKGSSGEWVRKLQSALGVHVTGTFDQMTEDVLKSKQTSLGLQADGVAGRNTYRALGLVQ